MRYRKVLHRLFFIGVVTFSINERQNHPFKTELPVQRIMKRKISRPNRENVSVGK